MELARPQLPRSVPALWRSLKMGYRAEPLLLIVGGLTTVAAALPDALFAVGFALFVRAVLAGSEFQLLVVGVLLAALAAGTWLLNMASERVNLRLAERAAVTIESHVAMLNSTVTTIEHQERPDYADMLELLRDHASTLSQIYRSTFTVLGAAVRLLLTVGLLISVNPWLGMLVLFAVPSVIVSVHRTGIEKQIEEDGAQDRRLARHLFLLGSSAAGGKEVRTAGVQDILQVRRRAAWERQYRALARARWMSAAWQAASWTLFGLAFVAGIALVTIGESSADALVGSVVLVVAAGSRLSQYVGQAVSETQFLRGIWLDASRRLMWLQEYADRQAGNEDRDLPERLRDGIRLEKVSFCYAGSAVPVLENVDLVLPAGSVIAVVGENGAGKSTLVKLLCRFYNPTSGRITVDGKDLAMVRAPLWRTRLGGAFQDFFRFEFRAGQAVGLGDLCRIHDEAAIRRAVERAGAAEVVAGLPQGLDTQLGNTWRDGVELSFGQWQRLALARGFMRDDPLLLVLDEPTAALDAETEHELFEQYAAESRMRRDASQITVLVSHRFSTVRMADLIVVLDGAGVAEVGTHHELMALRGTYAELYGIQEAGYR